MDNLRQPDAADSISARAMTGNIRSMSNTELERSAHYLRGEADKLISDLKISNDTAQNLQDELEKRYSAGFAQWVMDRLPEEASAVRHF
jgi:hypothetical protein